MSICFCKPCMLNKVRQRSSANSRGGRPDWPHPQPMWGWVEPIGRVGESLVAEAHAQGLQVIQVQVEEEWAGWAPLLDTRCAGKDPQHPFLRHTRCVLSLHGDQAVENGACHPLGF